MYCNYQNKFNTFSKGLTFLLLFFVLCTNNCFAQNDSIKISKHSLELQVFTNAGLLSKFEENPTFDYSIKRTFVIYEQQLSQQWMFCLAGDTYVKSDGKPYQLTPYLKRAYVQYHRNGWSIAAGLLVLEQFKYQRKIWKLRYIDKTFQCNFKYGENRNIGVLVKHRLNNHFSLDFALTSGYYTPIEKSSEEWGFSAGQTLKTEFCNYRLFNRFSIHPSFSHVISLFMNKKLGKGFLGTEIANKTSFNDQTNENQFGFSLFGNSNISKRIMAFARYDRNINYQESKTDNVLYTGFQYSFKNYLKASIYYQNKNFKTSFVGLAVFIGYKSGVF